jgi:hypothetical protein
MANLVEDIDDLMNPPRSGFQFSRILGHKDYPDDHWSEAAVREGLEPTAGSKLKNEHYAMEWAAAADASTEEERADIISAYWLNVDRRREAAKPSETPYTPQPYKASEITEEVWRHLWECIEPEHWYRGAGLASNTWFFQQEGIGLALIVWPDSGGWRAKALRFSDNAAWGGKKVYPTRNEACVTVVAYTQGNMFKHREAPDKDYGNT